MYLSIHPVIHLFIHSFIHSLTPSSSFHRSSSSLIRPHIFTHQMLTLKVNPYVWTDSSRDVKSSVLSVDLKIQNGSRLSISDLSQPIELFIPEKVPEVSTQNDAQGHLFVKPYNDSGAIRYHKITFENDHESALVEIRPENNTVFDVFVGAGVKPTPNNYTFRARIPDVSLCADLKLGFGYVNCTRNPYTFSLSSNVTGDIGVYYIGIRLAIKAKETNIPNKQRHGRKAMVDRNVPASESRIPLQHLPQHQKL